jgi:hypothetical protein
MPSDAELSGDQLATRAFVQRVGAARACAGALRAGGYRTLLADAEHLVFAREANGVEPVIVVTMRKPNSDGFTTALPGVIAGEYVDIVSGTHASLDPASTKLPSVPYSTAFFVPAGSTCSALASR